MRGQEKKTNEKNGKHDWQRKIGNVNKKSSHLQYNLINTFFSTLSLLLLLVHRTDTHTHFARIREESENRYLSVGLFSPFDGTHILESRRKERRKKI